MNLTMNKFSGVIPDALGNIHNLQQLYLAQNYLSGLIPVDLQDMTSLSELDVSFNDLQGEVPKEGFLRNISYLSIAGNKNLCGGIPQLHLDPCPMSVVRENNKRWLKYVKIALATMGALLFLALVAAIVQFTYKSSKKRQKSQPLAPIAGERYERVSYKELSDGTTGFSEANLLGKGSYGTVYKCTSIKACATVVS